MTDESGRGATQAALRALHDEHSRLVFNVLAIHGLRGPEAEDVSQNVWLAVYSRLADYDPHRSARAWVAKFARLQALDYLKRRRVRRDEVVTADAGEVPVLDPDPTLGIELEQAIPDPLQRQAFLLHVVCGMQYSELEELLEQPARRIRKWVEQAKKSLGSGDGDRGLVLPLWPRLRRFLGRLWSRPRAAVAVAAAVLLLPPARTPAEVACAQGLPASLAPRAEVSASPAVPGAPEGGERPGGAAAAVPAPVSTSLRSKPAVARRAEPTPKEAADSASLRWIAQMQAAAGAGRFAAVLDLAEGHERAFPGREVRERLGQRVAALCALGQRASARAVAESHREYPALARICAAP